MADIRNALVNINYDFFLLKMLGWVAELIVYHRSLFTS